MESISIVRIVVGIVIYTTMGIIGGYKQYQAEKFQRDNEGKVINDGIPMAIFAGLVWPILFFGHGMYAYIFGKWEEHYGLIKKKTKTTTVTNWEGKKIEVEFPEGKTLYMGGMFFKDMEEFYEKMIIKKQ